ncbi:MAG: histidine kinase [Micropruina glycogenica]
MLGLVCVAISAGFGLYVTSAGPAEVIGSVLLLLLFVAFAAVFRYRAALWDRQQRAVRNHERLALARELHDTVAHHVSAIAVQAQAGGVVVGTQPDQASGIFAAIESEASLTLAEMRAMVGVLRDDQADAYAPRLGVTALTGLVRSDSTPAVEVSLTGSLAGLPPAVDAAVYRIAQEALTNALRHARNATRVVIELRAEGDVVRVRVVDDGLPASRAGVEHGFGLPGMTERALMLGGSLRAGPGADRGWVVEAVLPARGLT